MTNSPELPKYKFVENVQSKVGKENVEDFYIGIKALTMFETHFNESRFQVQSATPSPWVLASSKKTS